MATIVLAPGSESNGLANMLAEMIRQNIDDHASKARIVDRLRGRLAIIAEDARVQITIEFSQGRVDVYDGVVGIPDLTIRASSEDITNMSLLELVPKLGIPDPRGEAVKRHSDAEKQGRIRVFGALSVLPFMLRVTRVMSINE